MGPYLLSVYFCTWEKNTQVQGYELLSASLKIIIGLRHITCAIVINWKQIFFGRLFGAILPLEIAYTPPC